MEKRDIPNIDKLSMVTPLKKDGIIQLKELFYKEGIWMEFNKKEISTIEWCMSYFAKVSKYGNVGEQVKDDIDKIIFKIRSSTDKKKIPIVETKSYEIDTEAVRYDSIILYREDGKEWLRGMVKHVDANRIKVVRSVGTNKSFSATQIGRGEVELKLEIY